MRNSRMPRILMAVVACVSLPVPDVSAQAYPAKPVMVFGFAPGAGGDVSALMPAVPTLHESGLPGYERLGWNGVLAPAAVSKEIVARLNATIVKAVNTTDLRESFVKQGYEVQPGTPE